MKTFQIELTDFCNHDCFYCYKKQDPKESCFFPENKIHYLYNEFLKIKDDICIRLTGGEPFLAYKELNVFLDCYCNTKNDNYNIILEIQTNLTIETNKLKHVLDKLKLYNKKAKFLISVQTYKQKLFEEITNTKGTFKILVDNLQLLNNYENIYPIIHIVVSKKNIFDLKELKNIYLFSKLVGIHNIRINSMKQIDNIKNYENLLFNNIDMLNIFQYAFNIEKELNIKTCISYQAALPCDFTEEQFNKHKDLLKLIYEQYSYTCRAGENMFSIDMRGNIKPCAIVPKSFCEGNVFEESLQSIMDAKFNIFKTLPEPDKCLTCKYYKQYCNGSCSFKNLKKKVN